MTPEREAEIRALLEKEGSGYFVEPTLVAHAAGDILAALDQARKERDACHLAASTECARANRLEQERDTLQHRINEALAYGDNTPLMADAMRERDEAVELSRKNARRLKYHCDQELAVMRERDEALALNTVMRDMLERWYDADNESIDPILSAKTRTLLRITPAAAHAELTALRDVAEQNHEEIDEVIGELKTALAAMTAERDNWKRAYQLKLDDFAAETLRASELSVTVDRLMSGAPILGAKMRAQCVRELDECQCDRCSYKELAMRCKPLTAERDRLAEELTEARSILERFSVEFAGLAARARNVLARTAPKEGE